MAAALAAVLLGATPRPALLTVYSAPAGDRPAGASPGHPTDAVLPDGRTAAPLGDAVFVGTHPQGVAVSPDGRYAIVSNDAPHSDLTPPGGTGAALVAGYSLAVVDTRTMQVKSVFTADPVQLFIGIAAVRDPANAQQTIVLASDGANNTVRVFDLSDDGTLTLEPRGIAMPALADEHSANEHRAFPATIDISADARIAYVVNNLGGTVAAIDLASRTLLHSVAVGFLPFGVASAAGHLYVTNGGLSAYHVLESPTRVPQFAVAPADPYKSSSLSTIPLDANGDLDPDPNAVASVRMDPVPDGVDLVGGARPAAIVARRDGRYAYVAMENVDRVATVDLADRRVVAGLDLRLFVNAPYGTQPSAETLSSDGTRLYVALAGINAVAVLDARDPARLHRLGLIPTAWYPSALTLSPDGRYLYVTAAKGVDGWGELQRVDLRKLPLIKSTLSALRYNRTVRAAAQNTMVPALRSNKRSVGIDRVVYISVGDATFDAMLGDLKSANGTQHGNGDPSLAMYPDSVTPNLHALAQSYALADNFYAIDNNLDLNLQAALSGAVTVYAERTVNVSDARRPLDAHGQDPDDYTRAGYLFNALARAGMAYRDYGGLVRLSGYEDGSQRGRPSNGLGGAYTLDVPALAALDGHIDLDYAGWNPAIGDARRAQAFIDDMDRLVKSEAMPAYTYVWLPTVPGRDGVADADRALGKIVEYLTHTPHWSSTAIFVVPDGVQNSRDHVNSARSYALVVSPFAKQGYLGHAHLSVASVVKTEEELLGLPPLALNDLLATDMADFIGEVPYPSPYQAR